MDTCEKCGHSGPDWQFHEHHVDRAADPNWTMTLCIPCHYQHHGQAAREPSEKRSVKIPDEIYGVIKFRAFEERRTISQVMTTVLEHGLWGEPEVEPESWPIAPEASRPVTKAEVDWATEDPVPVLVPVVPDPKPGHK